MNNQTIYWVWLQQALGYGSNKISSVMEKYTFAEDFYCASLDDKLHCGGFRKSDVRLLSDLSLANAAAVIKRCNKSGIEIVTIGDADYPELLMNISAPPIALYVKGDISLLSSDLAIAMVGTRNATPYGKRAAFNFGLELAKRGITVVSGGAVGIDSYSHRGALQAGGKTVCVLGCGIEYDYLKKNEELRNNIAKTGALVSEYPPDYPASRFTFPQRNRIISGLAKGVLVVEAGVKSGSLITANLALEQNRDVFAVPGDISSDVSYGTNRLIKAGAKPVTEIADILEEYYGITDNEIKNVLRPKSASYNGYISLFDCVEGNNPDNKAEEKKENKVKENTVKENKVKENKHKESTKDVNTCDEKTKAKEEKLPILSDEDFSELSENAQRVLRLFKDEKIHIDTVTEQTGLSVGAVNAAITELEMSDCIISLEGRMYKLAVRYTAIG